MNNKIICNICGGATEVVNDGCALRWGDANNE